MDDPLRGWLHSETQLPAWHWYEGQALSMPLAAEQLCIPSAWAKTRLLSSQHAGDTQVYTQPRNSKGYLPPWGQLIFQLCVCLQHSQAIFHQKALSPSNKSSITDLGAPSLYKRVFKCSLAPIQQSFPQRL